MAYSCSNPCNKRLRRMIPHRQMTGMQQSHIRMTFVHSCFQLSVCPSMQATFGWARLQYLHAGECIWHLVKHASLRFACRLELVLAVMQTMAWRSWRSVQGCTDTPAVPTNECVMQNCRSHGTSASCACTCTHGAAGKLQLLSYTWIVICSVIARIGACWKTRI